MDWSIRKTDGRPRKIPIQSRSGSDPTGRVARTRACSQSSRIGWISNGRWFVTCVCVFYATVPKPTRATNQLETALDPVVPIRVETVVPLLVVPNPSCAIPRTHRSARVVPAYRAFPHTRDTQKTSDLPGSFLWQVFACIPFSTILVYPQHHTRLPFQGIVCVCVCVSVFHSHRWNLGRSCIQYTHIFI